MPAGLVQNNPEFPHLASHLGLWNPASRRVTLKNIGDNKHSGRWLTDCLLSKVERDRGTCGYLNARVRDWISVLVSRIMTGCCVQQGSVHDDLLHHTDALLKHNGETFVVDFTTDQSRIPEKLENGEIRGGNERYPFLVVYVSPDLLMHVGGTIDSCLNNCDRKDIPKLAQESVQSGVSEGKTGGNNCRRILRPYGTHGQEIVRTFKVARQNI